MNTFKRSGGAPQRLRSINSVPLLPSERSGAAERLLAGERPRVPAGWAREQSGQMDSLEHSAEKLVVDDSCLTDMAFFVERARGQLVTVLDDAYLAVLSLCTKRDKRLLRARQAEASTL